MRSPKNSVNGERVNVKPSQDELQGLLEFAVELAKGAGDITLNYFRKKPETRRKRMGATSRLQIERQRNICAGRSQKGFLMTAFLAKKKASRKVNQAGVGSSIRSMARLPLCMEFRSMEF